MPLLLINSDDKLNIIFICFFCPHNIIRVKKIEIEIFDFLLSVIKFSIIFHGLIWFYFICFIIWFTFFLMFCSDIERIHHCIWVRRGRSTKLIFYGGNILNHPFGKLNTNTEKQNDWVVWLTVYGQGKNADALAQYFGENPAQCPCEQGKLIINTYSCCGMTCGR